MSPDLLRHLSRAGRFSCSRRQGCRRSHLRPGARLPALRPGRFRGSDCSCTRPVATCGAPSLRSILPCCHRFLRGPADITTAVGSTTVQRGSPLSWRCRFGGLCGSAAPSPALAQPADQPARGRSPGLRRPAMIGPTPVSCPVAHRRSTSAPRAFPRITVHRDTGFGIDGPRVWHGGSRPWITQARAGASGPLRVFLIIEPGRDRPRIRTRSMFWSTLVLTSSGSIGRPAAARPVRPCPATIVNRGAPVGLR